MTDLSVLIFRIPATIVLRVALSYTRRTMKHDGLKVKIPPHHLHRLDLRVAVADCMHCRYMPPISTPCLRTSDLALLAYAESREYPRAVKYAGSLISRTTFCKSVEFLCIQNSRILESVPGESRVCRGCARTRESQVP